MHLSKFCGANMVLIKLIKENTKCRKQNKSENTEKGRTQAFMEKAKFLQRKLQFKMVRMSKRRDSEHLNQALNGVSSPWGKGAAVCANLATLTWLPLNWSRSDGLCRSQPTEGRDVFIYTAMKPHLSILLWQFRILEKLSREKVKIKTTSLKIKVSISKNFRET